MGEPAEADDHVAMLDGIDAAEFAGTESLQEMPGFAKTLSDDARANMLSALEAKSGGRRVGRRHFVDWDEVRELIHTSYMLIAPKKLGAQVAAAVS